MSKNFLNNIELFNVANVRETMLGYALERYPDELLPKINDRARWVSAYSDACEIRFVMTGKTVRVNIIAENGDGTATVLRGDRTERVMTLKKGVLTAIEIGESSLDSIKNSDFFANDIYSKDVVRIVLGGARFILSSIDTFGAGIRPPETNELPKYTALAYGSSITHGSNAIAANMNYVSVASKLLDTQTLNKGLGGACFMENAVADWFSQSIDYDYMIFEAGTNMVSDFETAEIEKRGTYLLEKMFNKNPDKYIFLITPMIPRLKCENPEEYKKYEQAVLNMQKNIKNDKCVLIPFQNIELDTTYVSTDKIHPSTEAHVMMGVNFANILKDYLTVE